MAPVRPLPTKFNFIYQLMRKYVDLALILAVLLSFFLPLKSIAGSVDANQDKNNTSQPPQSMEPKDNTILNSKANENLQMYFVERRLSRSTDVKKSQSATDKVRALSVDDAINIRSLVINSKSALTSDRIDDGAANSLVAVPLTPETLPNTLELFPEYRANLLSFALSPKIYFGKFDQENEFPSVVLLPGFGNQNCSGTVIGPKWVITAAHCACKVGFNKILHGRSRLDSTSIDIAEGPFYFDKTICLDHVWKKEYDKRDVALYKLESAFPAPHHLILQPSSTPLSEVSIVGFGKTEDNPAGGFKYHAEVPVASEKCSSTQTDDYGKSAADKFNCIGEIEMVAASKSFKDTCSGDSGGPAFRKTVNDGITSYQLAGITSRGINGECGVGGIYVLVNKQLADWIDGCISESTDLCAQLASSGVSKLNNYSMAKGDYYNE